MSETPKTDAAYKACRSAGALGIIDPLTQCSALLERQLEEANERNGNMAVELAAMTQDRDALRRVVEVLVDRVAKVDCPQPQPPECNSDAVGGKCRECWSEWAKQQAAKAGKEGDK